MHVILALADALCLGRLQYSAKNKKCTVLRFFHGHALSRKDLSLNYTFITNLQKYFT